MAGFQVTAEGLRRDGSSNLRLPKIPLLSLLVSGAGHRSGNLEDQMMTSELCRRLQRLTAFVAPIMRRALMVAGTESGMGSEVA